MKLMETKFNFLRRQDIKANPNIIRYHDQFIYESCAENKKSFV